MFDGHVSAWFEIDWSSVELIQSCQMQPANQLIFVTRGQEEEEEEEEEKASDDDGEE